MATDGRPYQSSSSMERAKIWSDLGAEVWWVEIAVLTAFCCGPFEGFGAYSTHFRMLNRDRNRWSPSGLRLPTT